jgi:hypothetical protein
MNSLTQVHSSDQINKYTNKQAKQARVSPDWHSKLHIGPAHSIDKVAADMSSA